MAKLRVLLADDYHLVGEALAQLLRLGFDVVGTVAAGRALLAATLKLRPDIVVLDLARSLRRELDTLRQLKRLMPMVKVILVTVSEDPDLMVEAFRAGASAYLLKDSSTGELFRAIQEVSQGRFYVTPLATEGIVGSLLQRTGPAKKIGELSSRQREVLRLLTEGHTMKEIARILKITARTVAFHKYGMMKKLGIRTSAELVRFAINQRLASA